MNVDNIKEEMKEIYKACEELSPHDSSADAKLQATARILHARIISEEINKIARGLHKIG